MKSAARPAAGDLKSDSTQRYEALQAALDLIDQGITLINEDLQLVAWNRGFLRLLDFPPEMAYIGAPFESFIRYNALRGDYGPGDAHAQTESRVRSARAFTPHEMERVRPNGTVISVRGVPVPGHGFVTLYSDVTEQRSRERQIREHNAMLEGRVAERTYALQRSNEQLRSALDRNEAIAESLARSEARMRLITDSIPALVAYFGHDRHYHYVNRGYAEWFGLDTRRPESIRAREFLGEETYSRIRPFVMQAVTGTPVTFEYDVQTVHRGARVARTSLIPEFGGNGEIQGCFELTFDITDERLAQERLARAQKMEALGQLTGGLAHDFNNILTVVQGNLAALAEIQAQQPYLNEYIQPALDAARRGSDLIRGLLSFARKHPLSSSVVDLNTLVASAAKLLRNTLPDTLGLTTAICTAPIFVKLDPNQLQDALINLALNARDATEGKGKIHIACDVVHRVDSSLGRSPLQQAVSARITLQDDGCGMDQNTLARVFEPFFSTKAVGKGSGLGMSMVYGFVQQSGGAIDIRSSPGQGTLVSMTFPRVDNNLAPPPAIEPEAKPAPALQEGRRGLALLVEDDPAVRKLLRRELLDAGYSVVEAENAAEAIEFIDHTHHVALLLTDVVMPGERDGLDVVSHALSVGTIPQIVLMSGYLPARSLPEGVPFLQKPFTRAQLLQLLHEDES